MNPPTLNDLCHRAEALAQDLLALRENGKPPEKWAKERAAFERGEPVQWKWAMEPESSPWRDLDPNGVPSWLEMYRFRIKPSPEWKPKFKVGDRVKIRATNQIGNVTGSCDEDGVIFYEVTGNPFPYRVSEANLEPAPWTLSNLPGFRPLEDGEQYHRDDFTEEMLPPGWRPLLKGEAKRAGDEVTNVRKENWGKYTDFSPWNANDESGYWYFRTRRPLPDTERERFERAWLIAGLNLQWSKQAKETAWAIWQAARKAQ